MEDCSLICSPAHETFLKAYCEECNQYLCHQCRNMHIEHNIQDISSIKSKYVEDCEKLVTNANNFLKAQNENLDNVATEIADLITVQVTRSYKKLIAEIEKDMKDKILKILANKTVHSFVIHKRQQQQLQIEKLSKVRDEVKELLEKLKHEHKSTKKLINCLNAENIVRLSDDIGNLETMLKYMVSNRQYQIRKIELEVKYKQGYIDHMLKFTEPLLKGLEDVVEDEIASRKNKLIHLKLNQEFCLIDPYSDKVVRRLLKPRNEFPFSFDYIEIDNRVFISGGETTPGKLLKATFELDEQQGLLLRKARMVVEKKWHTLCETSPTSFYSVGGCNTYGALSTCEKYDISKNVWTLQPSMNEAKFYCGVAALNERSLFAFAGFNEEYDISTIEKLDMQDTESGWAKVIIANDQIIWSGRRNIGCYPISQKEILLFGGWDGNWRSESFIFNAEVNTLQYSGALLRGEKFYRSKPKKVEGLMYIIGYHYADLHIYNIAKKTWSIKLKDQWAVKL
eukprot:TRINITY_DN4522_c0_g1_i1.p1 TRINITY_DN4522_c0_g1~~TRINITY_DN4522_c0_g1_i1.p1  ORF type:complete len:567 (-),score=180.97 TRINITY_DN4522_c0_g1_i1:120-1649(-)